MIAKNILGNYITLCKKKNKNLEVTKLVGISYSKGILDNPRKASEAYLKTGWIAQQGEFVVDLVHVQDNQSLAIAINKREEPIVISHIYNVFKIYNPLLVGEYLLLLLKNTVMGRRLKYACHGSVRGTLSWDNFSKIPISAPILETQKRIVNRYQTISRFIEIKKRINELLEKKMRAYFHIMFDDVRDYEMKAFKELFSVVRGGRPPRSNRYLEKLYFCKSGGIPWLKVGDITREYKFVNSTEEQLTPEGFKKGRCTLLREGHILFIHHANSQQIRNITINSAELCFTGEIMALKPNETVGLPLLFYLLKESVEVLLRKVTASTKTETIKRGILLEYPIKFPSQFLIAKFNSFCEPIFELQKNNEQIIQKLLRLQKCWIESLD